jgi:hypothetical protein
MKPILKTVADFRIFEFSNLRVLPLRSEIFRWLWIPQITTLSKVTNVNRVTIVTKVTVLQKYHCNLGSLVISSPSIYLFSHKSTKVFIKGCCFARRLLSKLEMFRRGLVQVHIIKFHGSPLSRSPAIECRKKES